MPPTFKKLATIAIFFVAVKVLVDSPYFKEAKSSIAHRNEASATLDPPNLRQTAANKPPAAHPTSVDRNFDIVVYGDEVPGICAAIWAKKRAKLLWCDRTTQPIPWAAYSPAAV